MNFRNPTFVKIVVIAKITAFILFGVFEIVYGLDQDRTVRTAPERGVMNPGRSFTLSEIETISNYSGALMFNVSVGTLPPGRGGNWGTVGLYYTSKIWDMRTMQQFSGIITVHDQNALVRSESGNWRYLYNFDLKLDARLLGPEEGACNGGTSNTPWKLQLILPDGSEHTLYPANSQIGEDGFISILPDGRLACPNNPGNQQPVQGRVTFFTTDGTYLRLDILPDSDSPDPRDGF